MPGAVTNRPAAAIILGLGNSAAWMGAVIEAYGV
jgi:hypothetical protein